MVEKASRILVLWCAVAAVAGGCSDDDAIAVDDEPQDTCFETCWEPTTGTASQGTSTTSTTGNDTGSTGEPGNPYPEPDAGPPNAGPGGPAVAFEPGDLYQNCSFLDGGQGDLAFHNLLVMFDGYALMPFAPDIGGGGVAFFDISDPCDPVRVGSTESRGMRESHSVGIAHIDDRWFAVTNYKRTGLLSATGGVLFWDITDPTNPREITAFLDRRAHLSRCVRQRDAGGVLATSVRLRLRVGQRTLGDRRVGSPQP